MTRAVRGKHHKNFVALYRDGLILIFIYFVTTLTDTMNMSSITIKYPKFLLLLLTFALAYLILRGRNFSPLHDVLLSLGYFGSFLAGILFVYGFTAAPATAVLLIIAKDQHIILAGFIAGFGALVGDLLIFRVIRHSFADEVEKLSKEPSLNYINNKIPKTLKKYLKIIWVFSKQKVTFIWIK